MKIALVHDYLREYGGAERVVEVLHEIWPKAPLYTSFVDWPSFAKAPAGKVELFKSMDIRTSWVQQYPLIKRYISPLRFLAPKIWESFSAKGGSASGGDLSAYDVVLSSSGWFMCRGVNVGRAMHLCYIHHPPRNLYGYATGSNLQKYKLVRIYAAVVNFYLRHYDFETAKKVDYFIANSQETAKRVEKFYRRESTVIYPPIEVVSTHKNVKKNESEYYLSVGRLTYSKRIDLAIAACNQLKLPLKIVGVGKEEQYLRSLAGPTIEFLGGVSDQQLNELYVGAKALIFCALDEDFGMVPVEAMAHGVPVIGLAQGGVKETVIDEQTGILFERPEVDDLVKAMKRFEVTKKDWLDACIKQARRFSKERFMKEIEEFVEKKVAFEKNLF